LFDAVCVDDLTASDVDHIKNVIEKHLTVVQKIEHKFHPQGETIVFILAESHFTLHTYPENKYFSLDVYVCNLNIDLNKVIEEISKEVQLAKTDFKILRRGKIGTSINLSNLPFIYLVTIITASASILYELLLAQSLSTTMGNTALRYNTTIGIYIASMGFGALLYNKIVKRDVLEEFIRLELVLSLIGCLAPVLVLVFDFLFNQISVKYEISFFSSFIQFPLFTLNHLLIIIIGFLSGLELPLLIEMGKKFDKSRGNFVLAFDYLGTLIGAVLFPLVLLPLFHIFTIGYVVSALNVLVAIIALVKFNLNKKFYKIILIALFIVYIALIFNSDYVNQLLINTFYFGGKL
jgi:S-adenosylmethionine/arginine decarboxylase-like enzyme